MNNRALKFQTPTTLDEALSVIAAMSDQFAGLAEKADGELSKLRTEIEDAKREAKEATDREDEACADRDDANERANEAEDRADEAEGALQDEARELACALTLVRQGRSAEAQAAIDGILQRIDDDCKARMSAVVLPQFPGFA